MVAVAPLPRVRAADLLELTKPRIVGLVVATAAAGFYLAAPGGVDLSLFLNAILGTTLVAAGTNALNQVAERDVDAIMRRTARRPLPSGRLAPEGASRFAWALGIAGISILSLLVNLTTGLLAAATLGSYVFLYTPLKRRTTLATLVGGIPGALPIVGGWTAAGGALGVQAWVLFWILFLWQLPHFLALAWLYREDYARAGFRMLTALDPDGHSTGRQIALYCTALIPVTLIPTVVGMTGAVYFFGALMLSAAFCACGVAMALWQSRVGARRLFLASITYLPLLLMLMTLDRTLPSGGL